MGEEERGRPALSLHPSHYILDKGLEGCLQLFDHDHEAED